MSAVTLHHTAFVVTLLKRFDWTSEQKWVDLYVSILTNILSAHGDLTHTVLNGLVALLLPVVKTEWQKTNKGQGQIGLFLIYSLTLPYKGGAMAFHSVEEVDVVDDNATATVSRNVHTAIQNILRVVPTAPR